MYELQYDNAPAEVSGAGFIKVLSTKLASSVQKELIVKGVKIAPEPRGGVYRPEV
jgi:hypothetical protein